MLTIYFYFLIYSDIIFILFITLLDFQMNCPLFYLNLKLFNSFIIIQ